MAHQAPESLMICEREWNRTGKGWTCLLILQFFIIVQNAFDPPPLTFEHLVVFLTDWGPFTHLFWDPAANKGEHSEIALILQVCPILHNVEFTIYNITIYQIHGKELKF